MVVAGKSTYRKTIGGAMLNRREFIRGMGCALVLARVPVVAKQSHDYYLGRGTMYVNGEPVGSCPYWLIGKEGEQGKITFDKPLQGWSGKWESAGTFTFEIDELDKDNLKLVLQGSNEEI